MARIALSSAAIALLLAGCGNPVQDARIAALGPEDPAVPQSDIHRPGQPCLLCHGPYKGAEPEMTVAGTIYAYAWEDPKTDPIPIEGAIVHLTDSFGASPPDAPTTNCAGNFYLTKADWDPAFPLRAAVEYPVPGQTSTQRVSMGTRISRDGSCAGCHEGAPNQGSPGWVYCTQHTMDAPTYEDPGSKCKPAKGK